MIQNLLFWVLRPLGEILGVFLVLFLFIFFFYTIPVLIDKFLSLFKPKPGKSWLK